MSCGRELQLQGRRAPPVAGRRRGAWSRSANWSSAADRALAAAARAAEAAGDHLAPPRRPGRSPGPAGRRRRSLRRCRRAAAPTPPAATPRLRPSRPSCLTGPMSPSEAKIALPSSPQRLDPFGDLARARPPAARRAARRCGAGSGSARRGVLASVIGPSLVAATIYEGRFVAGADRCGRSVRRPGGPDRPWAAAPGSAGRSSAPPPGPARTSTTPPISDRGQRRALAARRRRRVIRRELRARRRRADPPAVDVGPEQDQQRRADHGRRR